MYDLSLGLTLNYVTHPITAGNPYRLAYDSVNSRSMLPDPYNHIHIRYVAGFYDATNPRYDATTGTPCIVELIQFDWGGAHAPYGPNYDVKYYRFLQQGAGGGDVSLIWSPFTAPAGGGVAKLLPGTPAAGFSTTPNLTAPGLSVSHTYSLTIDGAATTETVTNHAGTFTDCWPCRVVSPYLFEPRPGNPGGDTWHLHESDGLFSPSLGAFVSGTFEFWRKGDTAGAPYAAGSSVVPALFELNSYTKP